MPIVGSQATRLKGSSRVPTIGVPIRSTRYTKRSTFTLFWEAATRE